MRRALQLAGVVWLFTAVGVSADQNKPKEPPPPKRSPPPAAAKAENWKGGGGGPKIVGGGGENSARGGAPKAARNLPVPGNPIELLRAMTPEQRERALEKFPPDRQAQIRKGLDNFDKQNEAQKQRQLQELDEFYRLAPDKQQLVRQQRQAFNRLADDRKIAVRAAYANLSKMGPEERAERLARPQFQARFSPEELQILSVLSEYLPLPKR
jgi:Protein of unknown function (DUF3106)